MPSSPGYGFLVSLLGTLRERFLRCSSRPCAEGLA